MTPSTMSAEVSELMWFGRGDNQHILNHRNAILKTLTRYIKSQQFVLEKAYKAWDYHVRVILREYNKEYGVPAGIIKLSKEEREFMSKELHEIHEKELPQMMVTPQ